jgi:hypothetical protein
MPVAPYAASIAAPNCDLVKPAVLEGAMPAAPSALTMSYLCSSDSVPAAGVRYEAVVGRVRVQEKKCA